MGSEERVYSKFGFYNTKSLGEFNNYFKEMYDAQNLMGISLKKKRF